MFKTIRQTRAFIRVNAVMILVFWGCCHVELAAADSADAVKRVEATTSFRAIAHFPGDIRDAILELSLYPKLVATLGESSNLSSESAHAIAGHYPESAQQAAVRVSENPQVIQAMAANIEITTLLGIIYSHHADELKRSAGRIHEELLATDQQTLKRWATLLEQDGQALDEPRRGVVVEQCQAATSTARAVRASSVRNHKDLPAQTVL